MSFDLDATFHNCSIPNQNHFDNYEGWVRPMNKKLCLFENVMSHDFGSWEFQCHNNSNIALVCMEEPGAIGHELKVSEKYFEFEVLQLNPFFLEIPLERAQWSQWIPSDCNPDLERFAQLGLFGPHCQDGQIRSY